MQNRPKITWNGPKTRQNEHEMHSYSTHWSPLSVFYGTQLCIFGLFWVCRMHVVLWAKNRTKIAMKRSIGIQPSVFCRYSWHQHLCIKVYKDEKWVKSPFAQNFLASLIRRKLWTWGSPYSHFSEQQKSAIGELMKPIGRYSRSAHHTLSSLFKSSFLFHTQ